MPGSLSPDSHRTLLTLDQNGPLGTIEILHPAGTFAPTPATLIAVEAIAEKRALLSGTGLDWGSGVGCLAIAAARIETVGSITGLEISSENLVAAHRNAARNGVAHKTAFLLSESFSPLREDDRKFLDALRGQTDFILANVPSSEGDDGFGYRRIVLRGATDFLRPDGVVFLNVSYQYGTDRVRLLTEACPSFVWDGILASTDWVPFDLSRPDLLQCLQAYAQEEQRGGLAYTFPCPEGAQEKRLSAREALVRFQKTGQNPWTKWQVHLFRFRT